MACPPMMASVWKVASIAKPYPLSTPENLSMKAMELMAIFDTLPGEVDKELLDVFNANLRLSAEGLFRRQHLVELRSSRLPFLAGRSL